jgi:hypothetical protein
VALYKTILSLISAACIGATLIGSHAAAYEVQETKDPLKPYTKFLLNPPYESYMLRAYIEKDKSPRIDLYIVHSYLGDNRRYRSINVKWFDGSIKQPKLDDVSFDVDCSSFRYARECRSTNHLSMSISPKSWTLMSRWAKENPSEGINMQLQSQNGNDFDFKLKSTDILKFDEALLPHRQNNPVKPVK